MEQDAGCGLGIGSLTEVIDVPIGAEAADDGGAGWCGEGVAVCPDRDFAVVADAHAGLLAPDVLPPRTVGCGANDGSLFGERLLVGGVGWLADFTMGFVLVGVGDELVEQRVGPGEFADLVGRQQGRETLLPVVMAAFDFALGLGRGRVAQLDAVEVEGGAELGEGVRVVGVEKGVVVHIERQGQAVGLEDAGEEVEVGEQGLGGIESRAGVEARGVVEDFEEDLLGGAAGQEGMGRGVVLPEGTVIAGLPAFDGFGRGFVAGVGGELVLARPAADAGAVGFEVEATVEFAGDGTVRARWLGGEESGGQGDGWGGPLRVMIAAGAAGRPGVGLAVRAGVEVSGVEFVEAGPAQAQFAGGGAGADLAGAITVKEVPDERCRQPFDQLQFFIGPKLTGEAGFFAFELTPAGGPARRWEATAELPSVRLQTALRLRPRRALSSAEATGETTELCPHGNSPGSLFRFCSHSPVRFCSHHDSPARFPSRLNAPLRQPQIQ
jgi:hypothetical protein